MSGFVAGIFGVETGVIFGGGGWKWRNIRGILEGKVGGILEGKWLILGEKKVGDTFPVSPTFLTMFIFLLPTLFFSVRLYSEMTSGVIH